MTEMPEFSNSDLLSAPLPQGIMEYYDRVLLNPGSYLKTLRAVRPSKNEVDMTTPQAILYEIDRKLMLLLRMLDGDSDDEETFNIYEYVRHLEEDLADISRRQEVIEDTLHLIVKLLSKDEKV